MKFTTELSDEKIIRELIETIFRAKGALVCEDTERSLDHLNKTIQELIKPLESYKRENNKKAVWTGEEHMDDPAWLANRNHG